MRNLSLRWKVFLGLLAVMGVLQVLLAWNGYRTYVRQDERQVAARMDRIRLAFQASLDRAMAEDELLGAQLVATAGERESGQLVPPASLRGSELFGDLLWVQVFDLEGHRVLAWDARGKEYTRAEPAAEDLREVLAVARERKPRHFLRCDDQCLQHVFAPVIDRQGRELVAAIGDPIVDTALSFRESRGADIAVLAEGTAGAGATLWGGRVLLLTDAPSLLPRLRAVSRGPQRGEIAYASAGDRDLALVAEPLATHAGSQKVRVMYIVDETEARSALAGELRRYLGLRVAALLVVAFMSFLILTPPMRRLTDVSAAMPLLAAQRFDEARRAFAAIKPARYRDEVDVLRHAAIEVAERLQRLIGAEAASEAKSQFIAAMSHEIRTPINGLLGLLELHESSDLDDAQRENVRIMRDSALTLLTVIDDILDFSKIEAGKMSVEFVPMSLRDAVEGALETLGASAAAKRLRLTCYVDPAMKGCVLGDPVRVRQVLLNLCSNAIKFTAEGCVSVKVWALESGAGSQRIRCTVGDTGPGIAAEVRALLFKPFSQGEASTRRRYGGTGLGLSIAKGLVEAMGGAIGVSSETGLGSEFWFELTCPFAPPGPAEAFGDALRGLRVKVSCRDTAERAHLLAYLQSAGASAATAGAPDLEVGEQPSGIVLTARDGSTSTLSLPVRYSTLIREAARSCGRTPRVLPARLARAVRFGPGAFPDRRVLVAEDNPTNRLVIRQQLERLGVRADVVEDGRRALEQLAAQPYDVMITDLHLPEMDGIALVQEVRRREAGGTAMPIIGLTADVLPATVERCRAAGMDEVLRKPASLEVLRHALARWLPRQHHVTPPVDRAALARLMGTDTPALLQEVLEDFLQTSRPSLDLLDQAVRLLDEPAVRQYAHRLAGSARTIGARDLAAAAEALERAGLQKQAADFAALYRALTKEYEVVRREITVPKETSAVA